MFIPVVEVNYMWCFNYSVVLGAAHPFDHRIQPQLISNPWQGVNSLSKCFNTTGRHHSSRSATQLHVFTTTKAGWQDVPDFWVNCPPKCSCLLKTMTYIHTVNLLKYTSEILSFQSFYFIFVYHFTSTSQWR